MPIFDKLKKRRANIFVTAADIGGLFMAFLYIIYVALLLLFKVGYPWLNYTMLGITAAYFLFLMIKLLYINRAVPKGKIHRATRLIYRYTKLAMRFINAAVIILSIVNIQLTESHVVAVIGIIVLAITFTITLVWDLCVYFLSKKLKEIRDEWQALEKDQKKEKFDFFVDSILKGLDSVSGLDDYVEAGIAAGQRVGGRFRRKEEALPAVDKEPEFLPGQITFIDGQGYEESNEKGET